MSKTYSGFDPRTIPGCSLWLDAADSSTVTLSGSSVTQWNDKSGNGYNATAVNSPTLSGNSILLNGTNQYFTCPNVSYNPCNIFIVATYTGGSSGGQLIRKGYTTGKTYEFGILLGSLTLILYEIRTSGSTNINIYPTVSTVSGKQLYEMTYDNTTGIAYQNGTSLGSATGIGPVFTGSGLLTIGAILDDNNNFISGTCFTGSIQEVIIYTTPSITTQRQQIEGYLTWKWSIQNGLPLYIPKSPNFPGLQLWLDATDPNGNGVLPTNGSSLSTWYDKSGSGNTATSGTQVTFNTNGINNLPVVSFTAGPSYFNTVDLYSNRSFSVFMIVKRLAANSVASALIGGSSFVVNNNLVILFSSANSIRFSFYGNDLDDNNLPSYTGNPITEPTFLFSFTYTPGSRATYVNGALGASDTNSTNLQSTTNMKIGWFPPDLLSYLSFYGYIGEIIVLNGTPNTTQRQQIEGYLAWKWGLQNSLPSTHPYYQAITLPTSHPYYKNPLYTRPFQPIDIPGCTLWLDAADGSTLTLSGSNVTQWNDKSGNGYNLGNKVGTITYGIYQGNPCLQNTNGSYLYVLKSVNLTQYTFFIVCLSINSINNQTVFAAISQGSYTYNSTDGFGFYIDSNPASRFYGSVNANYVVDSATSSGGVSYPLRLMSYTETSSGTLNSYVNGNTGSTQTTSTTRTSTGQGFSLGGEFNGTSEDLATSVAYTHEVIVFNSVLSTSQRQQIEGYLAIKWGLQSSPTLYIPKSPNFSGLQLWLDATDPNGNGIIPTNGSSISTWVDK